MLLQITFLLKTSLYIKTEHHSFLYSIPLFLDDIFLAEYMEYGLKIQRLL